MIIHKHRVKKGQRDNLTHCLLLRIIVDKQRETLRHFDGLVMRTIIHKQRERGRERETETQRETERERDGG